MLARIIHVEPMTNYTVRLTFIDGSMHDLDLEPMLKGTVFERQRNDPAYFRTVAVDSVWGCLSWDNGADLDSTNLYARATGDESVLGEGDPPGTSGNDAFDLYERVLQDRYDLTMVLIRQHESTEQYLPLYKGSSTVKPQFDLYMKSSMKHDLSKLQSDTVPKIWRRVDRLVCPTDIQEDIYSIVGGINLFRLRIGPYRIVFRRNDERNRITLYGLSHCEEAFNEANALIEPALLRPETI
ncbi:MAG: DUF2442 domain-containing protein [Candidatus Poribacteria bacterium]|nr:DUF2442 domain-containing protein [Candidatus Poribacteria bacterium]